MPHSIDRQTRAPHHTLALTYARRARNHFTLPCRTFIYDIINNGRCRSDALVFETHRYFPTFCCLFVVTCDLWATISPPPGVPFHHPVEYHLYVSCRCRTNRINCVTSESFSANLSRAHIRETTDKGGQANDFHFIYGFICYFIS